MAKNQLKYEITAKDRSKQAMRSVQGGLSKTQGAVAKLSRVLAPLAAIFGAGVLGRRLIETNSNFQKLQASLTTFTGSAQNGVRAFKILQEFASKTPFSVQEVTASFNILIARGIKPTIKELSAFGDIAAGSGKSFSQLAEAVADAAVGEFERLKEFGIKAGKEKDKIVLSFGGATQKIKNDSASIIKALTGIAKTGFAGATARQAETLSGAFSNFGDAVDAAAFAIGEQGLNKEINRVTRELSKLITNNKQATRAIGSFLVGALRLAEKALKTVGNNLELIGIGLGVVFGLSVLRRVLNVARGIVIFTKAVAASSIVIAATRMAMSKLGAVVIALTLLFGGVVAINDKLRKSLLDSVGDLKLFSNITKAADKIWEKFGFSLGTSEAKMEALDKDMRGLKDIFVSTNPAVGALKAVIDPLIVSVKDLDTETLATGNALKAATTNVDTLANAMEKGVIKSTPQAEAVLRKYKLALVEANAAHNQTFASGAVAGVREYFDSISNNATNAKTFVVSAFQSLQGTLSNFFQTGEYDFKSFANAIKKGLADLAAKAVITTGINFLGSVFPSLKFAQGGMVPGVGGPTSDNQLAALSPGEFVMRNSSVKKFGLPFMESINKGQAPSGGGGGVGAIDVPQFGFGGFFKKVFKKVKKVVKKVVDVVKDLVGNVTQGIRNMVQGILDGDLMSIISLASSFILPGLGTGLFAAMGASGGFISGVTAAISKSFAAGILGAGSITAIAQSVALELGKGALVSGLSSTIVTSIDKKLGTGGMGGTKGDFANANAARFSVLYSAASPFLERRANGGPVTGGQPYLVGERGPEVFTPGRSGGITASMNSGQIVDAVREVRDEMSALRRQFGRALSGGNLAGARA